MKTEQELRDEFESTCSYRKEDGFEYVLRFEYFKKGHSLAQETIAEIESRLEQSVDIGVVNQLNETIKAKDAEIERLLEQQAKDSYKERAGIFDDIIEKKDKSIAEARCIIQTSLGFCGVNMAIENEKRANEWLKENKK